MTIVLNTWEEGAVSEQISHLLEFKLCLVVACFAFGKLHICYKYELLTEVVECDDLIEKHQVYVLEVLCILGLYTQCLFCISKEII